eukprot:scaffold29029_cov86-Attheya_sp.AAC.3
MALDDYIPQSMWLLLQSLYAACHVWPFYMQCQELCIAACEDLEFLLRGLAQESSNTFKMSSAILELQSQIKSERISSSKCKCTKCNHKSNRAK